MKIAVIGAGPAGNYCASLLAKKGHDVDIYEEKSKVGIPIQCTGILTPTIKDIIPIKKEFLVAEMKYVEAFSPNNTVFKTKSNDIIINRTKFDQYLAKMAQDNGAKLHLNSKFIDYNKGKIKIKQKKTIEKNPDIIIGADGPKSMVSKIINHPDLINHREFRPYYGKQALIKGKFKKDTFQVYVGNIAPKFFAWVVPENSNYARVGLGTKTNPTPYFNNLLKKLKIKNSQIMSYQGGLMPVYNPKLNIQMKNIYLLGDAATQIKSPTGGGIIPALKCAQALVKSIETNTNYRKNAKHVYKGLKLHLFVRKVLDNFSDKDYDKFVRILNKEEIKKLLAKGDRDKPIQLLISALKQPSIPLSFSEFILQPKFLRSLGFLL